jgi:hypothetical protein
MVKISMRRAGKEYSIAKVIPDHPTTKQTSIIMMQAFKGLLEQLNNEPARD